MIPKLLLSLLNVSLGGSPAILVGASAVRAADVGAVNVVPAGQE
jgi:hypothetical protein